MHRQRSLFVSLNEMELYEILLNEILLIQIDFLFPAVLHKIGLTHTDLKPENILFVNPSMTVCFWCLQKLWPWNQCDSCFIRFIKWFCSIHVILSTIMMKIYRFVHMRKRFSKNWKRHFLMTTFSKWQNQVFFKPVFNTALATFVKGKLNYDPNLQSCQPCLVYMYFHLKLSDLPPSCWKNFMSPRNWVLDQLVLM